MSASLPAVERGATRSFDVGWLLPVFGLALAVALGLAAGVPTPQYRGMAVAGLGLVVTAGALLWPFAAFRVMMFSVVLLVVYVVVDQRGVNALDILLGPVLAVSLFGGARARARREDQALTGVRALAIRDATDRLIRAALAFYGVAVLSLVVLGMQGHSDWAVDSSLLLLRALQGVVFFPIGLWWFRSERHIRGGVDAIQAGLWALFAVNVFYMTTQHVTRAGMAWLVNFPDWPISGPNEAASTLIVVWALVRARIAGSRPLTSNLVMAACLILLVATQSRSGLLAGIVFTLLSVRLWRPRTLVVLMVLGTAALAVPVPYWQRMAHTIMMSRGSFEAYSSLIRVYSWRTALHVFLDHPILGVGYQSYRFVSWKYNDLGISFGTAEQFFLETAAGMGVVGLVTLGALIHAVWKLGSVVRKASAPGTPGHSMARLHGPFFIAMLVPNLTGDNFVGMLTLAQVSVWCALLVRVGQLSVQEGAPGGAGLVAEPH